jgi:hypothetical protein
MSKVTQQNHTSPWNDLWDPLESWKTWRREVHMRVRIYNSIYMVLISSACYMNLRCGASMALVVFVSWCLPHTFCWMRGRNMDIVTWLTKLFCWIRGRDVDIACVQIVHLVRFMCIKRTKRVQQVRNQKKIFTPVFLPVVGVSIFAIFPWGVFSGVSTALFLPFVFCM